MQKALESGVYLNAPLTQAFLPPNLFRQKHYFHAFSFLESYNHKRLKYSLQYHCTGMRTEYTIQLVVVGSSACIRASRIEGRQNALQTYVVCNKQSVMFEVIGRR